MLMDSEVPLFHLATIPKPAPIVDRSAPIQGAQFGR